MSSTIDWRRDFPTTMRPEDLAQLYPYTVLYIKKLAQQRSRKIPTPCCAKPIAFRRDDVKRHYEKQVA